MRKITKTKFLILFFMFFAFTFANAAKGPQYRSLRVHGMGGAFVAVADGKEALYYNPAGLNLKKRFENFEEYPDMGYMPRQRYELRLFTVSVGFPANVIDDALDVCEAPKYGTIMKNAILLNFGYLSNVDWCSAYTDKFPPKGDSSWQSVFRDNPELLENLNKLDNRSIEIGLQISLLEFSMHNFGFATWLNTSAAPYIDVGLIVPGLGYEPVQVDAVSQAAFAFSPVDDWSVGLGLKAAKRHRLPGHLAFPKIKPKEGGDFDTNMEDVKEIKNDLENFLDDITDDPADFNFALDFGLLYQLNREVRLGSSLRNLFFSKFADESITPNLSIGAAYSPMILQSNSWWARKVNFAADYVDMIDGTVGDMFLAHLNFGAEIEQVVLPSPTRDLSFLPRLGLGVLGGALGFGTGHLIGNNFSTVGYITSISFGSLAGLNVGFGGDILRTSFGVGFEGGYSAWNIGLAITDALTMRFGSYAEERGVRTGQKEQRFWTYEVSMGF